MRKAKKLSKIYVWGTGLILARILDYKICIDQIEAFIDNDERKTEYLGKKVLRPQEIESDYDAIIVANMHTKEIYDQCVALDIDINKVLFLYNNIQTKDININYGLMEKILGTEYTRAVKSRYHLVRNISKDEIQPGFCDELYETKLFKDDYIRAKTLELVAEEIRKNNIEGETAELGVFQGDFSQLINMMFPDKKLYLFDTFESFDLDEFQEELKLGRCSDNFLTTFKNTTEDYVLSIMPYPDKCVVKKGLFPDTVDGLDDETFAFGSTDVDFEKSILEGLRYFYPRLNKGGAIFVHDYNNRFLEGVKSAVAAYENEIGNKMMKVPLADEGGTLVIIK